MTTFTQKTVQEYKNKKLKAKLKKILSIGLIFAAGSLVTPAVTNWDKVSENVTSARVTVGNMIAGNEMSTTSSQYNKTTQAPVRRAPELVRLSETQRATAFRNYMGHLREIAETPKRHVAEDFNYRNIEGTQDEIREAVTYYDNGKTNEAVALIGFILGETNMPTPHQMFINNNRLSSTHYATDRNAYISAYQQDRANIRTLEDAVNRRHNVSLGREFNKTAVDRLEVLIDNLSGAEESLKRVTTSGRFDPTRTFNELTQRDNVRTQIAAQIHNMGLINR